jgi:hypothetical protein
LKRNECSGHVYELEQTQHPKRGGVSAANNACESEHAPHTKRGMEHKRQGPGGPHENPTPSPSGVSLLRNRMSREEAHTHEGDDFQVVVARGRQEEVLSEAWTMRRIAGLCRAICVGAGTHHGLAILGVAVPPRLKTEVREDAGGDDACRVCRVPSLRSLCEHKVQELVDVSNVVSCLKFTEAVEAMRLRAFSIEFLFRNLDTAVSMGVSSFLSEVRLRDL